MRAQATWKIRNESASVPCLGLFKTSRRSAAMGASVWQLVAAPRGGACLVTVPRATEVYVREHRDDLRCTYRTRALVLPSSAGLLRVVPRLSDDRVDVVAELTAPAEAPPDGEIHVVNWHVGAVFVHLLQEGRAIHPARLLSPGQEMLTDVTPSLWAVIAGPGIRAGSILPGALVSAATEVCPGQSLTISGSRAGGFTLAVA